MNEGRHLKQTKGVNNILHQYIKFTSPAKHNPKRTLAYNDSADCLETLLQLFLLEDHLILGETVKLINLVPKEACHQLLRNRGLAISR